jgi:pimeloyl-ACP methyl ester carboxylesterase
VSWREFQSLQRIAELGDRFLSYVDQGTGEPVVLLHGMPTWGYLWHALMPSLAQSRRVLVPDLLGFGFSDKSDRFDRSIARQAETIDAWMSALRIDRASFVGHDIGGGVALRLATLFPGRVMSLSLINTVSYDSWPIEAMLQLGHPEARRRLSARAVLGLMRVGLRQGFAMRPQDDLIEGLLAPYQTEVGKLSLIRNAVSLNTNLTMEIAGLLPRISVPTQILWGTQDRFQRIRYGERLVRDIPAAELIRFEDARHFVMFDQPDRIAERLVMFHEQMPERAERRAFVRGAAPVESRPQ